MKSLCRRIAVLEDQRGIADRRAKGNGLRLRFASKRLLPRDYVGERHETLVHGWPAETVDRYRDCLIEERPGPGPPLDFDFGPKGSPMVVQFCWCE